MRSVIVLFEVNVKSGKMQDYLQMAGALKDSLAKAEGFIRSERFLPLPPREKSLAYPYGKAKNAFQNGAILPHIVWRRAAEEETLLQITKLQLQRLSAPIP